jgi:hypothetical protein
MRRALSTIEKRRVRALLMGGQACVLYGAAEFSRDADIAILATPANLQRLRLALRDLAAHVIAVPPLDLKYLKKGHAVHFRCQNPEVANLRIDVMTKMRGVDSFQKLWRRRTILTFPDGMRLDLLSLPDLVQTKKTQRDKDWPMIRRLVEANYFGNRNKPNARQILFWLRELRTPELLVEATELWPARSIRMSRQRPLLKLALAREVDALSAALRDEEQKEREVDREYWRPLRLELEALRHAIPRY